MFAFCRIWAIFQLAAFLWHTSHDDSSLRPLKKLLTWNCCQTGQDIQSLVPAKTAALESRSAPAAPGPRKCRKDPPAHEKAERRVASQERFLIVSSFCPEQTCRNIRCLNLLIAAWMSNSTPAKGQTADTSRTRPAPQKAWIRKEPSWSSSQEAMRPGDKIRQRTAQGSPLRSKKWST